jgi:hypothetical protein
VTFYEKERAQRQQWDDLLTTIKTARREADPMFTPNPFIDE